MKIENERCLLMKNVLTGLELVLRDKFLPFDNDRIGLLVHPASVTSGFIHAIDIFQREFGKKLVCLFAPQHGFYGETQDNMIEWRSFFEPRYQLPVYSLYSATRKPEKSVLNSIDTLVIDLQDVGARYYTFLWTMALCLEACAENKVKVVILDRPNPLGGKVTEGNISSKKFLSFVGLFPLPARYGLTIGELACLLNHEYKINAYLNVIWMEGWRREMSFESTHLPWVAPSPNMPRVETAFVYPGMCLLEGTNISEGRGTTLPFELFGAPFIQPWELIQELDSYHLPGVIFRPCFFQPIFHKFQGQLCGGAQIHIIDRLIFQPYLTGLAVLRAIRKLYGDLLVWKSPPYEYEYNKLPIDILLGTDEIRQQIDRLELLEEIEGRWQTGLEDFNKRRLSYLHYE